MKSLIVAIALLVLPGCSFLRSPTFWDGVERACEVALAARPEVKAEAERRKLVLGEFVGALCQISDIIEPFVVDTNTGAKKLSPNQSPADAAVEAAKAKGLVR